MPKLGDIEEMHDRRITLRLTASQYESIEEEAKLAKLPVSVYARHLLLSRKVELSHPIVLDAREIEPVVAELGRVGNNINQIARWLNRHTSIDDALRAEARGALGKVVACSQLLTKLATDGVESGVDAWRSLSTYR